MRPVLLVLSTDACRTAWDAKLIKKSVIERKLAPFFTGAEEKANNEMEECPICFLVRRRPFRPRWLAPSDPHSARSSSRFSTILAV